MLRIEGPAMFSWRLFGIGCLAISGCAAAVIAGVADWLAGLALAGGLLGIGIACSASMPSVSRLMAAAVRMLLILLSAAAVWTAGVDRSIFLDQCPICNDHRFVQEDRICGLPLFIVSGTAHRSITSLLTADLGQPCSHRIERSHRVRNWGYWYSGRPARGGLCCVMGIELNYSSDVSRYVREFAGKQPDEAANVLAAIQSNDGAVVGDFLRQVFSEARQNKGTRAE